MFLNKNYFKNNHRYSTKSSSLSRMKTNYDFEN